MPKINTIAIVPVPKLSDKLVGTSVGGTPVNQTNNFTLQQLKTLFDGAPVSPTLQAVLNAGNTATQNIYLTGTVDTVNLDVSNDSFLKNLYLSERLFDRNNFQGTSGQYLISTGTGVQWSTLTIATPTLQQVLTAGNISDKNIITTGNIQAANIQGTNITANTNLRIVGTLSDSSNSVGGSGQVLSSTVTGTDWIDFPSYSAVSPLIYNNVLKQFSIQVATSTQNGYLSSSDWITFNGKQNAGNYITALTGEASALGPGSVNITLNNLAVINKTLTGLAISSGVITAADSIITAFGKIQGQINGIVAGVVYQGVWNAATNTPTLTSSVGVQGHYYVVDVAGNTNLNGITDWQVGDWAIYNGTAWQKVDNTDAVTSVNGQTGIVVLNSDDIAEGSTNLYYLDSRARAAISSVATGLTYTSATGVFSLTAGYSIPTNSNQTNWTTAYNDSIVSAAVTGTTTKTLTLTQQDGGTITASWTDIDTNLVTSVFGRTGAVVAQNGDYTTSLVTEGTNLYYLDSRARSAISSSATGLTYTTATGVFSFTPGYSIPTDSSQSNWTTAYNDSITSAAVTGTTTKTLTLNQQDGGTITASWTDLDTGLTSVGLSMPSAFNVTNTPLTSNGTIAVTAAGLASQYVRGDGTLGDFPTGGGGGGASVSYYLNGSINQGTFVGNTYYQMSKTPITGTGTDFSISADGYIAQFITDAGVPDSLLIPGGNWNFELYFSASSSGGSPSFYVELYKYDGSTFTLISSGSATPELIAFGTVINPYFVPLAVPETVLALTDRIAIRVYVNHSGRTITLHTEDNHLCQIITTFTTGLTALNGLTKQIQYFAVGTSGTDFNISSSVDTHTFNLPTASSVNRGALSSADWTTFNSKQNAITLTTTGTSGPATLVGATLNIPDYGSALSGYVPYTGGSQAVNLGIYSLSAGSLFVNGPAPTSGSYLGFKQATSVTTGGGGYTSISTFGTSQMNFSFAQPSGFKEFKFDVSSITTGVPGGRVYTMPDADGTIALVGGAGVGTVTSVAALTLGTSGTDLSSTVANGTTTPVITLNVPTASATNRGALSSADWSTFNNKQNALTLTTTGSSGAATLVGATLNIPNYGSALSGYVPYTGATSDVNIGLNVFKSNNSLLEGDGVSGGYIGFKQYSGTQGAGLGYSSISATGLTKFYFRAYQTGANVKSFNFDLSSITNLTERNYILPDADGTIALTSDLGNYVTIGTTQTITGEKTFNNRVLISNSGTLNALDILQSSGSGIAVDISKAGNGEGLRVSKTSGTGNAVTITGGALSGEAATLTGVVTLSNLAGTGSRIVVADASGILSASSALSGYIQGTGTTNYLPKFTGSTTIGNSQIIEGTNTIGINTTGYTIGAGYTALGINNATNGGALDLLLNDVKKGELYITSSSFNMYGFAGVGINLTVNNDVSKNLSIATTGNVLIGTTSDNGARLQVSGTATFTKSAGAGNLVSFSDNTYGLDIATTSTGGSLQTYNTNQTLDLKTYGTGTINLFTSNTPRLTIASTGAATFSSSVRAGTHFSLSGRTTSFGYQFPDWQIYNTSGGGLAFNNYSTDFLTITSGGNVLIGTTTDNGAKLQVSGRGTFTNSNDQLLLKTASTNGSRIGHDALGLYFANDDTSLDVLRIYGGTSGALRLTIASTGAATFSSSVTAANLSINTTTTDGRIDVRPNGVSSFPIFWRNNNGGYGGGVYVTGANNMQIYLANSSGTENVLISSSGTSHFNGGNVGIGTSSPSGRLAIRTQQSNTPSLLFQNGLGGPSSAISNYESSAQTFTSIGTNAYIDSTGNLVRFDTSKQSSAIVFDEGLLRFFTGTTSANATDRMGITSGGNVLIGTTTDGGQRLQVSGTSKFNNNMDIGTSSTNNILMYCAGSNNPSVGVYGGAGSNSANGAASFNVVDFTNNKYWQIQIDGSSQLATFYYNGSVWSKVGYQTTGGTWTNSDKRRKENIEISKYGLNEVLQLKPKKFNYKLDERKIKNLGFIAQDVIDLIPESVQTDIDGQEEYYAMNYSNLVPVLVKAIQELKQEIDTLKNL